MSVQFRSGKFFFLLFLLALFSSVYFLFLADHYKPLHHLEKNQLPNFSDDMAFRSFSSAAENHLIFLAKKGKGKPVILGETQFSAEWAAQSIREFSKEIRRNPDPEELQQFIRENYEIYQAGGRKSKRKREMLVTGYYEPVFDGSIRKAGPFIYPIYSPPDDLATRKIEGKSHKGRIVNNGFVNYWTRAEIEINNLAEGYELAYLKDPFDAFLLQIQGSGRIRLRDGTLRTVRFAASNGHPYNSIGKLLVDENRLTLEEVSVPRIRQYLLQHPDQLQRILHHNPRFIFFNWGNNTPPRGSSGVPLTPGRSIAIDYNALPRGAIAFLSSRRPVIDGQGNITGWLPMNRFVFPQDSGSAIKGTGRVDMFWGHGEYAKAAANNMKEPGRLYFLIKKKPEKQH
jgi:membrane-bound lytic murein transglycosylase A